MKGVLSCVAACFILVRADALAQPLPTPIEPYRPGSFPVRTVVGPDHPTVTFSGTITPSITSRASSVAIAAPDVCRGGPTAIVGPSVVGRVSPVLPPGGAIERVPPALVARGPIPDVTDFSPYVRVVKGGQLTVQGRNLDPTQLVAMIGSSTLTRMAGSTSTQVLFRVDSAPQVGPLVVYNPDGQVRTLAPTYRVFDEAVVVTSVVPASFQQGDTVTLCGQSLFQAALEQPFVTQRFFAGTQVSSLTLYQGNFIKIGDKYLRVSGAGVSEDGSKMTFVAGDLYDWATACLHTPCSTAADVMGLLEPVSPLPASQAGVLALYASGLANLVTGPTVTWKLGGPHIKKAYGGRWHGPFEVLRSETYPWYATVLVEGTNLNPGITKWKIGSVANLLPEFGPGEEQTLNLMVIPDTASSAPICGTANGFTDCTPISFVVFGGPAIANFPASPLSIGSTYTIDGINLLPPPEAPGFTYHLGAGGTFPDYNEVSCNRVLKVLDHTAYHIVFRIGDPAVPVPSGCNTGDLFDPDPMKGGKMTLWGTYNGTTASAWLPQHYYLAK